MKNMQLITLIVLGCFGCANSQSNQNMQGHTTGTQRTWEFDDGSSYNELVIVHGDDFKVLYTEDLPEQFVTTFSELWSVACGKPLPTQTDRLALKALRGGEIKEVTIETRFGSRTFAREGEQTVSLLNQLYDVSVITDYDLDYYFHKDTDELIGWHENVNELPTGLRETQTQVEVDPNVIEYARKNCYAGSLDH